MKSTLALLLAPLLFLAVGSATTSSAAETLEVNVGVVQSLTGAGGVYGKTVVQGIDLAVSQINAAGGDNRIYISTTTMDDKSSVDGGKLAYNSFAEQKMTAIIGPTLSAVANGTLKIAQENRIVNLAPTTTALGITDAGDYVFNVALTEDTVVPATIKAVSAQTSVKRSVLFVESNDAFSRGSADAMRKGIAASGGSIVQEIDLSTDPDLGAGIASLSGLQFDSALVTPLLDKAVTILKAFRGAGYKQTVIGGNSFNTQEIARQAGDAAESAYVGAAWNVATVTPQNTRFVDAYMQAYGTAPDQYAAQGYASVQVLAAAVRKANSASPEAVKTAMASLKGISTPLGDVSFAANRYAVYAPVVQQIQDGQLTVLAGNDRPGAATTDPSVQSKRIMLIHSYDDQFHWTTEQGRGIVAGLSEAGMKQGRDYELMTYFMETRVKYTTADQVKARAAEALQLIEDYKPDLVFVTDDEALQYVAVPHAMGKSRPDLPFIFSGVEGDPTAFAPIKSLKAPGGPITGAIERIPFAFIFKEAQEEFPDVTTVAVLTDASPESDREIVELKSYAPGSSDIRIASIEEVGTMAAWEQRVDELQGQVGAIALLSQSRLKDERGNLVPESDVVAWTVGHSKIPVVAANESVYEEMWATDAAAMAAYHRGTAGKGRAPAQPAVFGQNAPAIAATEFDYVEMWAQDVGAMMNYQSGHFANGKASAHPITFGQNAPAIAATEAQYEEMWATDVAAMYQSGNPAVRTGAFVANMGVEVLKGVPPGQIAIVDPHSLENIFNQRKTIPQGQTIPGIAIPGATVRFQ